MATIKQTAGYITAMQQINRFLRKSTKKYSACFCTTKEIAKEKGFYCYTYEIANAVADNLVIKHNLQRVKTDIPISIMEKSKYIVLA